MTANCNHKWWSCDEYDSITNEHDYYLECDICGARHDGNINTRVHGSKNISIRFPAANRTYKYRSPIRYTEDTES
jgi:hypothetical protein